ncbi:hypothetical protein A2Y83_00650 [Candidatus Falkowbacteria bacterium RBG_13_39_14]|uniref:Uncharacterized protein n=1 Tax=Candidatus Falkowbacteria bacterium RBG_13_39_14 TaxID=1797985 RepID=A0A1F5S9C2_9BACT|nr:MAG: hypothetical protein A2Y83_00650 [Candidatus Falkowbacteria bacterium RBG_13_39_14]
MCGLKTAPNRIFTHLTEYLRTIASSYILLKKNAREKIIFMNNLRHKLEYKKIPLRDGTA